MENYMISIILSIIIGVFARAYMMKIDHRHISTGKNTDYN
jgi:hypothetical protein